MDEKKFGGMVEMKAFLDDPTVDRLRAWAEAFDCLDFVLCHSECPLKMSNTPCVDSLMSPKRFRAKGDDMDSLYEGRLFTVALGPPPFDSKFKPCHSTNEDFDHTWKRLAQQLKKEGTLSALYVEVLKYYYLMGGVE